MADIKPIKVWLTPPGPNPWKVVFILEELGVPYEIKSFSFANVKDPPFININPNGRVPAIEDPNTNLTLWETGAIILYLIEQYDKEGKLTHGDGKLVEKSLERQWLMFQVSGQGPYYGQAGWFNVLHPEKIPSAIDRYNNEIRRILTVLDTCLAKNGTGFIVGDRLTYADLVFVPYNDRLPEIAQIAREDLCKGLPHVSKWHNEMVGRPAWKRSMEIRARLMDEQGLDWNGMPKGLKNMKEYEELMQKEKEEGKS